MPERFSLSRAAVEDLVSIYLYGVEHFGVAAAERYQDGLERTFAFLARYPEAARLRAEVTPPSRAHPYREHLVFYRAGDDGVFIQRIRHAREDWMSPDA